MEAIKTLFLISFSHGSKVVAALVVIKLIAVNLGPEGMGFLGNYMSLISIATAVAGGGVITGAAKYVSGFKNNPVRQSIFVGNAIQYTGIFGALNFILGVFFSKYISQIIFGSEEYYIYICLFFLSQFAYGFVNLYFGVMNGVQDVFSYAVTLIIGNFIYIVIAYISITYYELSGAVTALTIILLSPIIPLSVFMYRKTHLFTFTMKYKREDFKGLFRFSIMLLVSAISFPLVEIYIRGMIVDSLGLVAAGTWQGVIKLSAAYLSFISIFLSFYIVPRLSAERNGKVILKVLLQAALIVFMVMISIFCVLYYSNDFLINVVLSESFSDVRRLLLIQIIGDSFRVMGWVIGFLVIAKAATKLYVLGELLQGLLFVCFINVLFSTTKGIESVVDSYVIACIVYFIFALSGLIFYIRVNAGVHNES